MMPATYSSAPAAGGDIQQCGDTGDSSAGGSVHVEQQTAYQAVLCKVAAPRCRLLGSETLKVGCVYVCVVCVWVGVIYFASEALLSKHVA